MPKANVSLPVWQGSDDNSGLLFPVTLESVFGTDSDMRPHDITFFPVIPNSGNSSSLAPRSALPRRDDTWYHLNDTNGPEVSIAIRSLLIVRAIYKYSQWFYHFCISLFYFNQSITFHCKIQTQYLARGLRTNVSSKVNLRIIFPRFSFCFFFIRPYSWHVLD